MKKEYCVISHTHWDREWYFTFEQFRFRLVKLIDNLLDIMEKEENLSSILKLRRAVKNQSWATGWKTGLPITWAE